MRNLMLAEIIFVSAIAPGFARAGEQPTLVQQTAPAAKPGFDRSKAFAIGAGLVIGATAASCFPSAGQRSSVRRGGRPLVGAWRYGERSEFATPDPRQP